MTLSTCEHGKNPVFRTYSSCIRRSNLLHSHNSSQLQRLCVCVSERERERERGELDMGCRNNREDSLTEDHHTTCSSAASSLSDALLFTTLCIIGLPVDVHVNDGSVYSGIFHTASVDGDYGIVLKKARMTKKGKGNSNVEKHGLVDTLVILSGDLVQVVAKEVMLPADSVGGNITGDYEEAVVKIVSCSDHEEAVGNNVSCSESPTCEVENHTGPLMEAKLVNQSRQSGDDKSKGNADDCRQKSEFVKSKTDEKIQSCNSTHETDTCDLQVEAVENRSSNITSNLSDNGLHRNISSKGVDLVSVSHNLPAKPVEISPPRVTDSTRNAKEFKLNPAAKVFSPSPVSPVSGIAAVPTAANMVYVPNSSPVVPVASIQPETGFNTFASRPSVPVKVAQYSNLSIGNGGSGSQFSQPIVGQLAQRAQPVRYGAHYSPVMSEPAYLQPSSPADLVHGATAISPGSARPLLNHVQFPKQQGGTVGQAMPICVPPPVITSAQQPFSLQSHFPVLQPGFPVTRPISVPGPNGFYGTKLS